MADVFMSYVSKERATAQHIAHALEASGFLVWWDRDIRVGADFSAEIQREIAAAKSVVVLWSGASQQSKWVRDEAEPRRIHRRIRGGDQNRAGLCIGSCAVAVVRIFHGLTSDAAQNTEILPARAAAERAIALDERLGEAHCALAVVFIMEWQWADAEREMLRSFDLGTADPICRSTYALLLLNTGRRAEAFDRADAALASAPLDMIV